MYRNYPASDRHKSGSRLVFSASAAVHQLRWIIAMNKLDSTFSIVMETETAISRAAVQSELESS
jgi:hypothetical protein